MHALMFTRDGRGGKFYQFEGTTVVAHNTNELAYLRNISASEGGQLVELDERTWEHDVICVHEFNQGMIEERFTTTDMLRLVA